MSKTECHAKYRFPLKSVLKVPIESNNMNMGLKFSYLSLQYFRQEKVYPQEDAWNSSSVPLFETKAMKQDMIQLLQQNEVDSNDET